MTLTLIGAVQFLMAGPQAMTLVPGISLGLNAVGATISVLVAFVGWIVLRYCPSYLVDEGRAARAQRHSGRVGRGACPGAGWRSGADHAVSCAHRDRDARPAAVLFRPPRRQIYLGLVRG